MQVFEWQERNQDTSLHLHMIAGSIAGLSEHLSMIPIDNVKTHCQAGRSLSSLQIINKIYKAGGLTNFYAGSSVVAMGCAPAHAIYFSIYEQAKIKLNCSPQQDTLKFAFVGALSAMFHDLIMTPTETLKQRLQLLRSQQSKISPFALARSIYKNEGLIAYYRSFPVNYAMNIPFGSLIIVLNEKLKHFMGVKEGDNSLHYYLCGGIAGGIASIPTTPLDVIKTKLNTQNCSSFKCQKTSVCNILRSKIEKTTKFQYEVQSRHHRYSKMLMQSVQAMSTIKQVKYRNIGDTAIKIWRQQGCAGFFKGIQMRMLIQSISSGVAWGTYQIIKSSFQTQKF